MPSQQVNEISLYYEDRGEGQPIVFLHGLLGSRRAFQKQIAFFSDSQRALALDFRGHGRSSDIDHGHTVPQYAADLKAWIEALELDQIIMVGWSMGALVMWEFIHRYGTKRLNTSIVIDQIASDYRWPEFPIGLFDLETITQLMENVQIDPRGLVEGMIPQFFHEDPLSGDIQWLREDAARISPAVASAILFDQSMRDYRHVLPQINLPTLLCFAGKTAGEDTLQRLPHAALKLYDDGRHALHIEHADRFNQDVADFLTAQHA